MGRLVLKASLLAASVALLAAPTAYAEGFFTTSMDDVSPNAFDSRIWNDTNSDANGTSVSLRYCSTSNGQNSFELKLWKGSGLFAENRGAVSYYCPGSTWKDYNWGRQAAGAYHYQVSKVGGNSYGSTGDADGVNVYY